ncbi:hypothetical protein [Spiroplasma poulsonii]|nr:hypothetical protein [Spiroplasma poulsonii]
MIILMIKLLLLDATETPNPTPKKKDKTILFCKKKNTMKHK